MAGQFQLQSRHPKIKPWTAGMNIIGVDLSGPRNVADTCVAAFEQRGSALEFAGALNGARDREIFELVSDTGSNGPVVIGIDAPLSYNPGGGDRPSDKALRQAVLEKGGGAGVMPPTMIRMVYLTLRGVAVTRMLNALGLEVEIQMVEVHPCACMLLRGAPAKDVAAFKREPSARLRLLKWLEDEGLRGLLEIEEPSDHFVAACAAALAAWQWSIGQPAWCVKAQPPDHPFDFAC
jgi:uncharacterized protein